MRPDTGRPSAAAVVAARRRLGQPTLTWQVRCMPVCASSEEELSLWLRSDRGGEPGPGATSAKALLTHHQRFGHGQRGRPWSAPPGGVWLSADLPWPEVSATGASLSLAVAVGLALELEALDLAVRIKWPNDLLVGQRKIAGLLPRLRWRGSRVVGARVGLGLNGSNPVPPGAINTNTALAAAGQRRRIGTAALTARVLRGLEWAVAAAGDGEAVRAAAEARLLPGAEPVIEAGVAWEPVGLDRDGALRVRRGDQERRLVRTF